MRTQQAPLVITGISLIALTGLSIAFGQSEREGRRSSYPPQSTRDSQPDKGTDAKDAHLANWLLIDSQVQLELNRFAWDRAESEAVQDFAEDLVESHSRLITALSRLAGPSDEVSSGPRRPSASSGGTQNPDRQRVRQTAADEVLEKQEAKPVRESKDAGRGTGQETGPTGTRARDVRQGETGTDDARTIVDPARRTPPAVESSGPAGVGTRGRTKSSGTTGDELRARDRRLDAFDRVGNLPVSEQNRSENETREDKRARLRLAQRLGIGQLRRASPGKPTDAELAMEDIGRERIELAERELGRYRGEAFDHAFLHQQVVSHLYSISMARGLRGHVSSDLEDLLEQAEQTNRAHLNRAKQLLIQLDEEPLPKAP